jgi:excisionase family DNA binding protein
VTTESRYEDINPQTDQRVEQGKVAEIPLRDRLGLSVQEAGTLLGISRDLAYDLVASGELPSVRLGRRIVVPRHALENVLATIVEPQVDGGVRNRGRRWR